MLPQIIYSILFLISITYIDLFSSTICLNNTGNKNILESLDDNIPFLLPSSDKMLTEKIQSNLRLLEII